ncbi:small nuclear ribonucleoprotein G-like isoform X2 [Myxocyprinus asiaticus]|uniref:small nuclear ribonucleoprotein G-like isoform X2 n=1 Tax=Myxocyprinus asiaticus TaxID=70543 RepID=UPI002221B562|nr:small nuclear ribonucleoprotein G-like isoform X2 [Myxocyprinus asiaticus]
MDKKLSLKLNGGRHVQGVLRGFDPFMNLVVDDCIEMAPGGQMNTVGMVVIRGNSIIMLEALERVFTRLPVSCCFVFCFLYQNQQMSKWVSHVLSFCNKS